MATTTPSRTQIEQAGELTSPDRRPPAVTITIHAVLSGYTIDVCYTGSLSQLGAAVERLRAIGAEPIQPAAPVQNGRDTPRKSAQRVQPAFDANGDPLCPVHKRPLKEGNWGLYCSAKDPETGSYCRLKFAE